MGNVPSAETEKERREEEEREKYWKRQQQLRERGVLVPPSFGVARGSDSSPSCMQSLKKGQATHRLLHDELSTGLIFSGTTSAGGSATASFNSIGTKATVDAGQQFDNGQVYIRTTALGQLSLSGQFLPTRGLILDGHLQSDGLGRCGWQALKAGSNDKNLEMASWLRFQSPSGFENPFDVKVTSVEGFAKAHVSGCDLAVEATVPANAPHANFSYHFSSDLSRGKGPPLVLGMDTSPTKSSVNLSQTLSFDRLVYDPRADLPKIRNRFGWAVEMEKYKGENEAKLKAGIAWQVNRGLALKVVANQSDVRGAVLLKRWKEPRVSCSLIFGINPQRVTFHGIGLELGTGPSPDNRDVYSVTGDGRDRVHVGTTAPPTKETLPKAG